MRKFLFGLLIFLISTITSFVVFQFVFQKQTEFIPAPKQTTQNRTKADQYTPPVTTTTTLPGAVSLTVPFTPQAPAANWDELHNDACEEASAIMVAEYFNPTPNVYSSTSPQLLLPNFVEQEISKLTKWLDQAYGYHLSTNTEETANMIEQVYGFKTTLVTDFSETNIKQALSENKLVILPANGRLLNNPNFKAPGPIYHMLVITGYDKNGFITNDPGTRRGLNYLYDFETLHNAAAEWNNETHTTDTNIKTIIIVEQ